MITRFNLIENVGVFKSYRGGPIQFDKLNYIYAGNASGKSTLSDVLKDVSDDHHSRISKRLTIPDGKTQKIVLSTKVNTYEQTIKYNKNNRNWDNNLLKDKIIVFDTKFIQNNVFSGLEFLEDRSVKENFSGFLLGDSGVKKAEEIENLNIKLREERKKLKEKIPLSQVGNKETQVNQYIEIKIDESLEEIQEAKQKLEIQVEEEKKLLDNSTEVLSFTAVPKLSLKEINRFADIVSEISEFSTKTFQITTEDINKIMEHINNAFHKGDKQKAKSWIQQGVSYLKETEDCPFCGQDVKENELISNYHSFFNEEFNEFSADIRNKVEEFFKEINNFNIISDTNITKIKFDKAVKIFGSTIESYREELNNISEELEEFILVNSEDFAKEKEEILRVLQVKKNLPTAVIQYVDNKLVNLLNLYREKVFELNNIIEKINNEITKLKEKSQKNDKANLEKLSKKNMCIDKKLTRLLEEQACSDWKNHKGLVDGLIQIIKEKNEELITSQEQYLDSYFTDINFFFNRFGGHNFTIERGKDNNLGNKKVFGVNILYCGKDIAGVTDSSKIFSESDRRALALSIFMAKLKNIQEAELSEMIIVFDDPVTSFDMDRMKTIAKSMIDIAKKAKQIFILSHQYSFSKTMYQDYGKKMYDGIGKIAYYQIVKTPQNNSEIQKMNPDKYFDNEFMTQYMKILDFINGESSNFTGNDLRIFIEDYLETSFPYPHAKEFNVAPGFISLDRIINSLKEEGYINNSIAEEITIYKDSLNTPSHNANTMSTTQLRSYSREVLEFLDINFRIN